MNTDLEAITERWQNLVREEPGEYRAARYRVGGTPSFGVFILAKYPEITPAMEMGPISPSIIKSTPLPEMKGIGLSMVTYSNQFYLSMELKQVGATDVFFILAAKLCEELREIPSPITAYSAINEVLSYWKAFFATDRKHLGESSQTGLYGELLLIRILLDDGISARKLLRAWRGSEGAHQDFQFPGISVETKSTVAVLTDRVSISSLRQLESIGAGNLYLAQVILDQHEYGSSTLPHLIDDLRKVFSNSNTDQLAFEEKLLKCGYRDDDDSHYSGRSYSLRKVRIFLVDKDFPKLTSSDVMKGILGASYEISLEGVMNSVLDLRVLVEQLRESDDE